MLSRLRFMQYFCTYSTKFTTKQTKPLFNILGFLPEIIKCLHCTLFYILKIFSYFYDDSVSETAIGTAASKPLTQKLLMFQNFRQLAFCVQLHY